MQPSREEKGLMTIECFLGCAESAVLVFTNYFYCENFPIYSNPTSLANKQCFYDVIKTADLAQSRKYSIVARLFPHERVRSGHGTKI